MARGLAVDPTARLPGVLGAMAVLLLMSHQGVLAQHVRVDGGTAGGLDPAYSAANLGDGHSSTVLGQTVFATYEVHARPPPNPLPCQCTDVVPHPTFISRPNYTCWEQYKFGKCNQPFMLVTIQEIPEGYCQITCGHCPCCPTLAQAAGNASLTEFLWAMNHTTPGVLEALNQPGLLLTVLAPTDAAMLSLYNQLGGKDKVISDTSTRDTMTSILSYHVLPPLPYIDATWTTPFFLKGTEVRTANNQAANVTVSDISSDGTITLAGPYNSARIVSKDIYACMGWVNTIDTVLLPFQLGGDSSSSSGSSAGSSSNGGNSGDSGSSIASAAGRR